MFCFPNGGLMVEAIAELPDLRNATNLYLDFETASFTPARPGDSPYKGDRICGIAVCADDSPAYYVSVRHRESRANLPIEPVFAWLNDIVFSAKNWVNHNVKFDAHFLRQDGVDVSIYGQNGVPSLRLVDTLVLAKLRDSDRQEYGLKPLSRDWLNKDMSEEQRLHAYLKAAGTKDYADAPADICGEYACQDVIANRELFKFLDAECPPEVRGVWETEILATPALFDMECNGMPVDVRELQMEAVTTMEKLSVWEQRLVDMIGAEFNPKSSDDMRDLFLNHYGLPIVAYTVKDKVETTNPSFDKEAMIKYLMHPKVIADPKIKKVVELIRMYRDESDFLSMFPMAWLELQTDGLLHPDYNQTVRTGRMSCRKPNAQQLNKRAKALIHPGRGEAIVSCDYSQVEFRLITHYINDAAAVAAYQADPNTDFHKWVASVCGVKRKAAKTINFMMAFGGGKAKTVSSLAANPDIVDEIGGKVNTLLTQPEELLAECQRLSVSRERDIRNGLFDALCKEKALWAYNTYHERLPGLKKTTYRASDVCKARGFVFNAYGRRRHLPTKAVFKSFNAIVQSCAADLMKERMIAAAPRYNPLLRSAGINHLALVHDDNSYRGPKDALADPEIQVHIKETLENTTVKFRVPIRTGMGYSQKSWKEAADDDVVPTFGENGRITAGPVSF